MKDKTKIALVTGSSRGLNNAGVALLSPMNALKVEEWDNRCGLSRFIRVSSH